MTVLNVSIPPYKPLMSVWDAGSGGTGGPLTVVVRVLRVRGPAPVGVRLC